MSLRFGGASADGGPGDEIGSVLRNDWIQKLSGCRQTQRGQIEQQPARFFEAGFDIIAAVEVGIVNEPFPADGGARLFEVNAHDDFQLITKFVPEVAQLPAIIE